MPRDRAGPGENQAMGDPIDPYFDDFSDSKPFSSEPKSSGRGCVFYGCVGVLIAGTLGAIALAVLSVFAIRFGSQLVEEYTATVAEPVPIVELASEEVEAIERRVETYQETAEEGEATTLSLTAEEINGLIARNPNLRGRVAVAIEGDELRGKISFPLENLGLPGVLFGGLRGRYLNGEARFQPILIGDGIMRIQVDELIVKGQPVPKEFLDQLNQGDSTIRFDQAGDGKGDFLRRLDRIDVENGAVILTSRGKRSPSEFPVEANGETESKELRGTSTDTIHESEVANPQDR